MNGLELILDFRSLELHPPDVSWTDLKEDYRDYFGQVFDTLGMLRSYGVDNISISKLFIYLPREMEEEYARQIETSLMGHLCNRSDYDSSLMGKYRYPNRYEYWIDYLGLKWRGNSFGTLSQTTQNGAPQQPTTVHSIRHLRT